MMSATLMARLAQAAAPCPPLPARSLLVCVARALVGHDEDSIRMLHLRTRKVLRRHAHMGASGLLQQQLQQCHQYGYQSKLAYTTGQVMIAGDNSRMQLPCSRPPECLV